MASERIIELLRRPVEKDEYADIRELWKTHSIAEDNRDLAGLISTLTDDCVYEVRGTSARWEGHEGAARFYTELLTAFPDIHFDLEYIVVEVDVRKGGQELGVEASRALVSFPA